MKTPRWAWMVWFYDYGYPVNVVAANEANAIRVARGVVYGRIGDQALTLRLNACVQCEPADWWDHMGMQWDCLPDERGEA